MANKIVPGLFLGLLALLLFGIPETIAVASAGVSLAWSTPVRISKSENFPFTPFMVADSEGNLHVVWSQNDNNIQKEDLDLSTIYYTERRGGVWSTPMDIFAATGGEQARVNRLRIDDSGRLHLVYVTWSAIVYATAPAGNAGSTSAWQATRIGEPAWLADFALSRDGTVHLVYALQRQGIYYRQSKDEGATWSSPIAVWLPPGSGYSPANVRIEVDSRGILHVAAGIASGLGGWKPAGIIYARSVDDGKSWEQTLESAEGDTLPNIGFDSEGGVHIVFDNPAGSSAGRGHAYSTNDGAVWAGPERIFPGYRGQTWWPVMERDSADALHLIFTANPPDGDTPEAFHSVWMKGTWSEPELVSGGRKGMEGPSLAVSGGNILNVVWFSYLPEDYGIWYSFAQTSAPAIAPRPVPTAKPATPTPLPTQAVAVPSPQARSSTATANPARSNSPLPSHEPPWFGIAVGLVPAVLLVGLLFFKRAITRREW